MACTMPGFPDKYMPFMDEDINGRAAANIMKFTYGAIVRTMRRRNVKNKYDREPEWRRRGKTLTTGYKSRSAGYAPPGS
jgi:hydrogenase small subunit